MIPIETPLIKRLLSEGYKAKYSKNNLLIVQKDNIQVRENSFWRSVYKDFCIYIKEWNKQYYKIGYINPAQPERFDEIVRRYKSKIKSPSLRIPYEFSDVSYNYSRYSKYFVRHVTIFKIYKISIIILEEDGSLNNEIGKPNVPIWFHLKCLNCNNGKFELIINDKSNLYYPVIKGRIATIEQVKNIYMNEINYEDRDFIHTVIEHYLKSITSG